jgi:uncharacterized membrane protein YcaP (DUF421 family)
VPLRLFGKKELAQLSVTDLVFILLISNAVQNAMVGPDTSLAGGLIAATCLFLLNAGFKWLMFKNKKLSRFIEGHPVLLIHKGHVLAHNLEHEEISLDELNAAMREHGVQTFADVGLAVLEVDGNISVLSNNFVHKTTVKRRLRPRKQRLE